MYDVFHSPYQRLPPRDLTGAAAREAMARGTPVVTSDVTALPGVVGDAGLTVAPRASVGATAPSRRVGAYRAAGGGGAG